MPSHSHALQLRATPLACALLLCAVVLAAADSDAQDSNAPPALAAAPRVVPVQPVPTAAAPATTPAAVDAQQPPTPADLLQMPARSARASAAAARWPVPAGLTVNGYVQRLEWQPTRAFAAQVAARDAPVILRNTAVTQWPAAGWTPGLLWRELYDLPLRNVKRTYEPHRTFYYYHSAPLTPHKASVGNYKDKAYTYVTASSHAYFRRLEESDAAQGIPVSSQSILTEPLPAEQALDPTAAYSWAAKADELDFALHQMDPTPLMVIPQFPVFGPDTSGAEQSSAATPTAGLRFDPSAAFLYRQTYLWTAPGGTTTPAHYDLFHNFYFQSYGHKRFLLFPPSAHPLLGMQPVLHPAQRSARVDLNQLHNATYMAQFPTLTAFRDELECYEAVLEPGDVLYVPPLWFHHVTALSSSISVSVWSHYQCTELWSEVVKTVPLPFLAKWDLPTRVQALRLFLESLAQNLKVQLNDGNVAQFVDAVFLQNRYAHVPTNITQPAAALSESAAGMAAAAAAAGDETVDDAAPWHPREYCYSEGSEEAVLAEAKDALMAALKKLKETFTRIHSVGGQARFENYFADYIEVAANEIVGAQRVKDFLLDFVYC